MNSKYNSPICWNSFILLYISSLIWINDALLPLFLNETYKGSFSKLWLLIAFIASLSVSVNSSKASGCSSSSFWISSIKCFLFSLFLISSWISFKTLFNSFLYCCLASLLLLNISDLFLMSFKNFCLLLYLYHQSIIINYSLIVLYHFVLLVFHY